MCSAISLEVDIIMLFQSDSNSQHGGSAAYHHISLE